MASPLVPLPLPGARALDGARQADSPAKVRELAHEFEGMLLAQMLRQMRQSIDVGQEDDGIGLGYGKDLMTDAIDVELARQLSLAGGLGIADLIVDAFEKQQALQTEAAARAARGSTESQRPIPLETPAVAHPIAEPAPPRVPERTGHAAAPVTRSPSAPRPAVPSPEGSPVSAVGTMGVAPSTIRAGADAAVPLPGNLAVTSRYGWRDDPFTGRARFHGGVDVAAAYGTAVPSVAAGRVVEAAERGAYGLTVVVEHGPGLRTRYAHLSASLVREGDTVAVGQTLGRVGSSGRSTGPHLHFEVLKDGQRVDPQQAAARFRAAGFKSGGETADSSLGGDPSHATEE
jgi:murein DD-endopeptidase MepM/ murein hydrolase activator NlpD